MRTLAFGALALLVLTACGEDSAEQDDIVAPADSVAVSEGQDGSEEGERMESGGDIAHPPNVVVRAGDQSLSLQPYAFCWGNGCADGAPPEPPPDIGEHAALTVEFPEENWEFSASFRRADDPCARTQTLDLERRSPTTFELSPAGFADTYVVDLFGQGDTGDVATQFRWTTTADGALPEPWTHLAILAEHDGEVDSYGVEFAVGNLARSPEEVAATITVTAAGGESLSFEPTRSDTGPAGCETTEGLLSWYGPERQGLEAAALGDPPFTYTVELLLDGERYAGTATWPDDEIPGNEPAVYLEFEPALPALSTDDRPTGG
ncbi:hypothetical protein [Phytoactinopolyspora halotolerans]|uniref:Uncharacterized protein n=1 Tax=Phytoactinopolyspora halotolerans TaxID=1981512 RepID=A0A6L9SGU2_9ACTN|nr:hypothetical protein [Phytoactinopolyspora halotolerans]NEE04409.1 hypothetical protein [Phytoactinopolyspora halotolerans]